MKLLEDMVGLLQLRVTGHSYQVYEVYEVPGYILSQRGPDSFCVHYYYNIRCTRYGGASYRCHI